jgi:putative ABC transport system permease protein
MRSIVALKILLYDKATTAGSLIGVIAIVFLVGQQLAVLFGLFSYMSVLVDHSGADIWICSKNTDNINATDTLPERYADRVSGLSFVDWAEPVLFGNATFITTDGKAESLQIVGLRPSSRALWPWRFHEGSALNLLENEGLTLERLDLGVYGNPEIGDVFEVNDVRMRISAITQGIKGFSGRLAFTNVVKARKILKTTPGRCKAVVVKLKPGTALEDGIAAIQRVLPETEVMSSAQLSARTRIYYVKNTGMGGSFGFSTMIGALVGIIIITLTMYTGVLQRQKDFAVLRALGARKVDIFVIVLCQSMIIALTGIFIGFFLLGSFLNGTVGTNLPVYMPRQLAPMLAIGTLLLCMLGSLMAVRKAISVEPASVFR